MYCPAPLLMRAFHCSSGKNISLAQGSALCCHRILVGLRLGFFTSNMKRAGQLMPALSQSIVVGRLNVIIDGDDLIV